MFQVHITWFDYFMHQVLTPKLWYLTFNMKDNRHQISSLYHLIIPQYLLLIDPH